MADLFAFLSLSFFLDILTQFYLSINLGSFIFYKIGLILYYFSTIRKSILDRVLTGVYIMQNSMVVG